MNFNELATTPLTKHEQFMFALDEMNLEHDAVMLELTREFTKLLDSLDSLLNDTDND